MKQVLLVGVLAGALAATTGAQTPAGQTDTKPAPKGQAEKQDQTSKPPPKARPAAGDEGAGHTAPKTQPPSGPAAAAPTGEVQLGPIHLTKAVKADGKPLPAGTYQLRVTAQQATPDVAGQTGSLERWAEFVQKGQVKGREVVTIIPQGDIDKVQKDTPPHANASKVETLKGGDYVRVWFNKGGNHYLLHLPAA